MEDLSVMAADLLVDPSCLVEVVDACDLEAAAAVGQVPDNRYSRHSRDRSVRSGRNVRFARSRLDYILDHVHTVHLRIRRTRSDSHSDHSSVHSSPAGIHHHRPAEVAGVFCLEAHCSVVPEVGVDFEVA